MRILACAVVYCLLLSLTVQAQSQVELQATAQQSPTAKPDAVAEPDVAVEVKAATEVAAPDAKAAITAVISAPDAVKAAAPRPTAGISLGKMALSLGIVVAIVLVLGWVFKKLTLRLPGSRHIKIISTLALGQKERLLVIEMQGKQRVIGVTANSVNFLFELENPLPEEKLASDFHTQLQSLLKK